MNASVTYPARAAHLIGEVPGTDRLRGRTCCDAGATPGELAAM